MADIVTDLGVNYNWKAYKVGHNEFTIDCNNSDGSAFNLSSYVFTCRVRKIGTTTDLLTLTEGSGITNGGASGVLTIALTETQANTTLPGDTYFYEITYLVGGVKKRLIQGILTLSRETNPASTTTSLSATININGTTVSATITLAGVTSSSIATALGTQSANVVYAGPSSGSAAVPAFRALVDADIPASIARLASPAFTGTPTAPTAAVLDNTTKIASTAYVQANALVKAASGADGLRPSVNLLNIPGTNAGTTPFQFYHHGMITGQDISSFPNNKLISAPKGLVVINWSVNLVNNWVWNETNQRAEAYHTDLPMLDAELGGEGFLVHYTKPGSIPATDFHEICRFGGGVEGFSSISPYTTYVPFNQFKSTIFAKYQSTTTPPPSTEESWWGGSGNTFQGRLNPMLWLHSEEVIGSAGTFNLNEYARYEMNASASGAFPSIYFYKSQGTFSAKTAQGTTTITGKIGGNIYDGATYQNTANIAFTSGATVSSGNAGGQIVFQTSNTNTAGLANRMRISQTGTFEVWTGAAWDAGTAGYMLKSIATGVPVWSNVFGASGGSLGFFGVTAVARQVVPTGSTADNIITALQNLGLFSQT